MSTRESYTLRTRRPHADTEQRPYSQSTVAATWDALESESEPESESASDDNISIDSDSEGYQLLVSRLTTKSTGTRDPVLPKFLEHIDDTEYRSEGSDSDTGAAALAITPISRSAGQKRRTPATPRTPKTPSASSLSKTSYVLTVTKLQANIAELRTKPGCAKKKITDGQLLDLFLNEEGFTCSKEDLDRCRTRINRKRVDMLLASKRGDSVNGEDVIYTSATPSKRRRLSTTTPTRTPTRTVEQRKPFAALCKCAKRNRLDSVIDTLEDTAEENASQACSEHGIAREMLDKRWGRRRHNEANVGISQPDVRETLAHMVKINATKRNATSIAQFANKHGLKLQGERALRTAKRKRVPPLQKGRFITVDGEDIPGGVFKTRKDLILYTIKELIETGHIVLSEQHTPGGVVVLHMTWNQMLIMFFGTINAAMYVIARQRFKVLSLIATRHYK